MRFIFLVICIAISFQSFSQVKSTEPEQWEVVDVMPDYPGGMGAFFKYVQKNLKYPQEARKEKIEGKVFVEFVIDSTGHIDKETVKVVQGIGYGCDEEAIRIIKNSLQGIPGRVTKWNKNSAVRLTLPIEFKK